jgi:hypothetical protein
MRKNKIFNQSGRIKSCKRRATFARGDGWPADAEPAIAGYCFGGNPVAGYGVADIPVTGDVLPATGSSFTFEILINTSIYYMFSQINVHILYILVKLPTTTKPRYAGLCGRKRLRLTWTRCSCFLACARDQLGGQNGKIVPGERILSLRSLEGRAHVTSVDGLRNVYQGIRLGGGRMVGCSS